MTGSESILKHDAPKAANGRALAANESPARKLPQTCRYGITALMAMQWGACAQIIVPERRYVNHINFPL